MSAEHERYATWDAAYALGALNAHERAEFETHLAECGRCRAAVGELASTTALLSRLSAEDAEQLGVPSIDDARVVLGGIARRRRRTRRRRIWTVAGIAAALAIAVPVGVAAFAPRPAVEVALQDSGYAPATATVALTPVAWGTRLEMTCTYAADAKLSAEPYVLAVVGADGKTTELSSWRVSPGATARLSAGSALPLSGIRSVEIRDPDGHVLLRRDLVHS